MQNDIQLEHAKQLVENGARYLIEGANMPTTNEAIQYLQAHNVVVGPSKAANAGGVACSCLEMSQNAQHIVFSAEDVYAKLEGIMVNIFKQIEDACDQYNLGENFVAGANIAGFERVAKAMMWQGLV